MSLFGATFATGAAADPVTDAFTAPDATLSKAVESLGAQVERGDADARTRFAHALAVFFRSGERGVQQLYEYGAGQPVRAGSIMMFRGMMQAGRNEDPKKVTPEDVRRIMRNWLADLHDADELLAAVPADGDWKLRLDMAEIQIDFNGDGQAARQEEAARAFAIVFRDGVNLPDDQRSFVLGLDATDLHWLRAYNDVLMALGEIMLAYDNREIFNRCAHLFFPRAHTPYPFLQQRRPFDPTGMEIDVSDVLAFVGSLEFPLADDGAERMSRARQHLLNAIGHSRDMWKSARAETDDDREWLPAPHQSPAMRGVELGEPQVRMWLDLLDEAEALLKGEKLLRFWRGDGSQGIDVRAFFEEPRAFNVLYWVQGSAAKPYLVPVEDRPVTRDELWADMQDTFGDDLFRSLFYIN
ncbi:hypothetical protein AY599_24820 [Leptolyngbya valderiana BDU 20041]|nr:hypothetical protein AY599_24820 [Leptolyngbya valderiana BDU 20041]